MREELHYEGYEEWENKQVEDSHLPTPECVIDADELCARYEIRFNETTSPVIIGETMFSLSQKYLDDKNFNNIRSGYWDGIAMYHIMTNPKASSLKLKTAVELFKHSARKTVERYLTQR